MAYDQIILPSTFRSRISVKVPITLTDSAGGIGTSGYTEQFSTFAYVESLSVNRLTYYGMDLMSGGWLIKLRYNADRVITTGTVIGYKDNLLIVTSVQIYTPDNPRFLLLLCTQSATS